MKKFSFRLQRVLDYRNILKKDEQRKLAERNHELKEAETRRDLILEAQDSNVGGEGTTIMAELQVRKDYGASLHHALIEQRLLVLEAAEAVERARMQYIERSIESETLETLKDKKKEIYKEEARKSEQRSLDERTVQQHGRKKLNSSDGE